MKTYELLSVIKPNIDSEETDKIIEKINSVVAELGGNIINTEKIGRKKLSYDIQSFRDGFYVSSKLALEPKQVSELSRQLKLNEALLRTMFTEEKQA